MVPFTHEGCILGFAHSFTNLLVHAPIVHSFLLPLMDSLIHVCVHSVMHQTIHSATLSRTAIHSATESLVIHAACIHVCKYA